MNGSHSHAMRSLLRVSGKVSSFFLKGLTTGAAPFSSSSCLELHCDAWKGNCYVLVFNHKGKANRIRETTVSTLLSHRTRTSGCLSVDFLLEENEHLFSPLLDDFLGFFLQQIACQQGCRKEKTIGRVYLIVKQGR